jgi:hypothetical protein
VTSESSLRRSVHALHGYRRLASMRASVTAPDAVPCDHILLQADAFGDCSLRRVRMFPLLQVLKHVWIAMLSMMKQMLE